jgi:D-alanyl-D-alanine carboxypeptidase
MEATLRRPLPALTTVGLALAALVALLGGAALDPGVARAMGPLPACRYADIETAPHAYQDWPITLVDTILRVSSTYAPPDLVSTKQASLAGGGSIRKVALADLKAMTKAAREADAPIAVQSAYRSYTQQKATFQHWVDTLGFKGALKVSARPGHSEHQLGLAIDFRSDLGGPPWSGEDWAKSPAGSWMLAHAWTFGWVLSYPRDAFDAVCYSYEPWHYRYVGRPLAAKIHGSGLTIRAYLWANFTTAEVPPLAAAHPSANPGSSPVPSESPAPSASAEPTASPTAPTPAPATASAPSPATSEPPSPAGLLDRVSTGALAIIGLGLAAAVGLGLLIARRARPRSGRRF